MIVRSNLNSSDTIITDSVPLKQSLEKLFSLVTNPESEYFIESEYLLYRLFSCTNRLLQATPKSEKLYCPFIFDSWSCFNSSPAGSVQFEKCPKFEDLGFESHQNAAKICDENGSWWIHPETNKLVILLLVFFNCEEAAQEGQKEVRVSVSDPRLNFTF